LEALERRRFLRVVRFRAVRAGGLNSRFWLAAVELTHDIGANRPRRDLRGLRLLALAVRGFVRRADEAAFDEDMGAFLNVRENNLREWSKSRIL